MKLVKIAYAIFFGTLVLVVLNSVILRSLISDTITAVEGAEEQNTEKAEIEYSQIYKKFKSKETYIAITVNHEDMTNIEDAFSEVVGAAEAGDREGMITAKNRLIDALQHLKRLSGINIDSIL